MKRIVIATLVFMVLVLFGIGSSASAQTSCPNIEGVWDFDQTYIELCYTTPPHFYWNPPEPYEYAPGIVQGQTDANPSGTPTYVRKTGTQEIFQDPNNNCLFWGKRIVTSQGRSTNPSDPQITVWPLTPNRVDWYVGTMHSGGNKLTMRVIPSNGTPATRTEGKITNVDRRGRPKEIEYLVDTDVSEPLCGPGAFTGADAGMGTFYNRR
jgi:hypothetical protein